jgi:hypothetical protein
VLCGRRDDATRCRALAVRATDGRRRVTPYDAVRFDLAGHLVLTPHDGVPQSQDIDAWLVEPEPDAER